MRHVATLLAAIVLAVPAQAAAQPIDAATRAAARQLGEEGMAAYDKGDCAAAAEKLTRAHEMVHVPTLAFYAGRCLEKLGRLVDASEAYLAATRDEIETGAPSALHKAQDDAVAARSALLPRIPTFELALAGPATDVSVTLDGKPFPIAALGVTRPIDPGAHVAEARRGAVMTRKDFAVEEADHGRIVLAFPASADDGPHVAPRSTTPASPGPWIVGSVGIASLVVGAVTGAIVLQRKSSFDASLHLCSIGGLSSVCTTPDGDAARSTVNTLGPVTTVALVVGGAALAAGGVWLALTRKTNVGIAPASGGVTWHMEGTW